MPTGRTISLYLPEGNPKSIRIAEITNRTIQAISIPRAKLKEVSDREELGGPGIYFLIGESSGSDRPLLYIGKANRCIERLKQQNRDKEFWTTAIAVVSRTNDFEDTHISYLEYICCKKAKEADRYDLDNNVEPQINNIRERIEHDLKENFENICLLIRTLGCPIFEITKQPQPENLLYCEEGNAKAQGTYTEEGLTVLGGSKCKGEETAAAGAHIRNRRKKLILDGVLKKEDDVYVFTRDYIFDSPSAAASTVLGCAANGWMRWKYIETGKTLDEVIRREV